MDGGSTEYARGEPDSGLEDLQRWWVTSEIAVWCLVLLGAFVLNAILLFAFLRKSGLRTISNRFVMNLAVSNLLTSIILAALITVDGTGFSGFAWSLCVMSEGATALVTTSSVLSVLLIAVDQYFAVVDPLRYRTRVDKVKCGLLILAVWSVAAFFGLLATVNPNPRNAWKICANSSAENVGVLDVEPAEDVYPTYGLLYALVYAFFAYLLPFTGVCWIYASIYSAARKNSERTRRTGSRPILSTGSFCEEYYYPVKQEVLEECRRIPKISSLSSIDESIESVTPSQMSRSKSSEFVGKKPGNAVIFTLGAQQVVDVGPAKLDAKDDDSKVPIAALRAEFLEKREWPRSDPGLARSKFPETTPQRRKSSYDLMHEEIMLRGNLDQLRDSSEESESDDEDNAPPANPADEATKDLDEPDSVRVEIEDLEEAEIAEFRKPISLSASSPIAPGGQQPFLKPPLQRISSVRSTSGYINHLKHRISNASLFKYREETRAARVSALVIVMGLICWTPHAVVLVLQNISNDVDARRYDVIALCFLTLSTYVSPLLFGYRSKRVKRELRRFFCFRKELSYKNNRSLMAKKVLKRRSSGHNIGQLEVDNNRYNIFNCVYGKNRWPKEKVQFVQVPDNALAVETCRSSFSSGASTQISTTSTDEC